MNLIFDVLTVSVWTILFWYFVRGVQVSLVSLGMQRQFRQSCKNWATLLRLKPDIRRLAPPISPAALDRELDELIIDVERPARYRMWPTTTNDLPSESMTLRRILVLIGVGEYGLAADWRDLFLTQGDWGVSRTRSIAVNAKEWGLQGTLLGIGRCFFELEGGIGPEVLASLALALMTTAAGLLIAWIVRWAALNHETARDMMLNQAELTLSDLSDAMARRRVDWNAASPPTVEEKGELAPPVIESGVRSYQGCNDPPFESDEGTELSAGSSTDVAFASYTL